MTTQLLPLAVATRFLVEATASRNQPRPQTDLPRLCVKVSSTNSVMTPWIFSRVKISTPTRYAKLVGVEAERSRKL